MATGNSDFLTLAATTLQNFANEIFDNVVTNNTVLFHLRKAGNLKVSSGGRQFTHPVFYQSNSTFAAISKLGTVPVTIQDNLTRAVYDLKVIAGSVVLSQVEMAMNAGDREKLIDYVEEKKMEAITTVGEILGDQVFNTTVTASGSLNFDSIPYIITTTPGTTSSDVGGIDATNAANTYWQNIVGTTVTGFGTSQEGLNQMDTLLNACTFGKQGPKIIVTTKALYTKYSLALTANARYTSMQDGDGAFRNLMYNTLPVMFDDNAVSGKMYFIDTDSLRLQVLNEGNFMNTEFQQTQNQLVKSMLMYFIGNITCGSRRTQGVLGVTG